MSGALPIRIAPRAARSIRETSRWWAANRSKAPLAFAEELERAFELIAQQPGIGARAQDVALPGVRRIQLARVRYYLYFRVAGNPPRVEVLALWHVSRGAGPSL